jgi:hypothetical protein
MNGLLAFLNKRGEALIVLLILLAGTLFCIALLSTGDLASQLGETIGGITAPILSFSGIVLLYLTFREHTQSVRIQEQRLRDEREAARAQEDIAALIQLSDSIHNNLRHIAFPDAGTGGSQTGFSALARFSEHLREKHNAAVQISDESLWDFLLNIRSMIRGMQAYLTRNATAALSLEQRLENYRDLDLLRGPLNDVFESCAAWMRSSGSGSLQGSEPIGSICSLKPLLDAAFGEADPASPGTV